MKNLFKRKKNDPTAPVEGVDDGINSLVPAEEATGEPLFTQIPSEPLTPEQEEQIAKSKIGEDPAIDEIPTANASERDSGNNKKLQVTAIGIVAMLVTLIGVGVSVSKYQAKKAEDKAAEAEKTAQDQKKMATGTGVNISKDQQEIKAAQLSTLPPPAGATSTTATTTVATTTPVENPPLAASNSKLTVPPARSTEPLKYEPVEPVTPPKSKYSGTSNTLVAGRDYSPPGAMPSDSVSPSITGLVASDHKTSNGITPPLMNTPLAVPPPKGANSGVMVDVSGIHRVSATSSDTANGNSDMAKSLRPTVLADVGAGQRGDRNFLMMKGTTIPCVLKTRIDSTYKGFTVCQISKDVYSANGETLLIERGSSVFGEQNVDIKQGQARVAVLWTKIETPKGVSINIDSPATGQVGEMGIGATVNNHYWQRFSSSIMLSMIQDGLAAAANRYGNNNNNGTSSGSNNTTVSNTSNTVQNMAEKALDNSINIAPTATVKQGTIVNIMVVRDVDFSSVYRLHQL